MSFGYREFDEFANTAPMNNTSPQLLKLLRDVEQNTDLFRKNVDTIENLVNQLNTPRDTPKLRDEITRVVADTAQLAKIANQPIQNLRLRSSELSPSDRSQFERLMTNFSSTGIKFKQLQRMTQNLERQLLNEAKQSRDRSYSEYSDTGGQTDGNPFGNGDSIGDQAGHVGRNDYHEDAILQEELQQDAREVEEREQHMRQLETDILDINDIFRDLGTMVNEQGDMIDNIEANVEIAGDRVEQGNTQLGKAVRHKKCSRKLTLCIFLIVLGVVIALIIGVLILLGILKVYTGNT